MTTAAPTGADPNEQFHEECPVRRIHTRHTSWQAMLKLVMFSVVVAAFIHGLGQAPAQSPPTSSAPATPPSPSPTMPATSTSPT